MAILNFDASQHPVPQAENRIWSPRQVTIFDFVAHGHGNAIVKAVAGSGKTTTIVEALERVNGSSVFLAFNKSIAEELKARGVNARTFHSLTYSAVTRFVNARNIESDKLQKLMRKNFSGDVFYTYGVYVSKLVSLGKQSGIGCLLPDVEQTWMNLINHHDLELESGDYTKAIELASELLAYSNESEMVDFDDLLYIPVKHGLSLAKFDFIFVDEAQDTNAIQRALIRMIMKPNSRLVAVGDKAQAIYGFRGADSNSLSLIQEEFNCIELPLNVSYRCAQDVVKYAQQWYPEIEAAPNAQKGEVKKLNNKWDLKQFESTDLVVCRTTKPLIQLMLKFISQRIPATVMGREIGQSLVTLIRKLEAGSLRALEKKLDIWSEREIQKAIAKGEEGKAEIVRDKTDAILCLIECLEEQDDGEAKTYTINDLVSLIDKMFEEKKNVITLATIHKAKGLEADRVYWLNSSQCPSKWAKQDWQKQQEVNLCYVAATRAKRELCLIEM